MKKLTQKRLKKLLLYDKEVGLFRWRVKKGPAQIGQIAGTLLNEKYRIITIDCKSYSMKDLVWLYKKGKFPKKKIIHKNGNPLDNRFKNLAILKKKDGLTFYQWLILQIKRDDIVGDLAIDAKTDKNCPKFLHYQEAEDYLSWVNACSGAFEALKEAWAEFKIESTGTCSDR